MKFSLSLHVATCSALAFLALAGAASAAPGGNGKRKPPPVQPAPPVVAGAPGTITHVSYAADGATVLSSETFAASASDSEGDRAGSGGLLSIDAAASCCSANGCDYVEVSRTITDWTGWDNIGTFHHAVYWCWDYPSVTYFDAGCWSETDGFVINDNGCDGWGHYYYWRGSYQGGHYSFRQASWSNCVFHWGCWTNINPWIEIWVNGNGAWAQNQGE